MNFSEGRQGGCGRTPRTPLNPPLLPSDGNRIAGLAASPAGARTNLATLRSVANT